MQKLEQNKKAFLFLGGQPPKAETLEELAKKLSVSSALHFAQNSPSPCIKSTQWGEELCVVCADGAFNYLKNYFLPDIVVGDFDSVDIGDIPKSVEKLILPPEKDFTDGHVAMQYIIDKGIKNVTIFGGGGNRPDHTLSNYSLLQLAKNSDVTAVMDDGDFLIYLASGKFSAKTKAGKIVSLVPYSDLVHILSTRGLRYPISNRKLDKVHILGISNIADGDIIDYNILSGNALVFLEK